MTYTIYLVIARNINTKAIFHHSYLSASDADAMYDGFLGEGRWNVEELRVQRGAVSGTIYLRRNF